MATKWEAPEGKIWVCGACGKTSKNRIDGISPVWDISCFSNAVLVDINCCIFSHNDATKVVKVIERKKK